MCGDHVIDHRFSQLPRPLKIEHHRLGPTVRGHMQLVEGARAASVVDQNIHRTQVLLDLPMDEGD